MMTPIDELQSLLAKLDVAQLESLWTPLLGQGLQAMRELLTMLDEPTVADALQDFDLARVAERDMLLALLHDLLERSAETWQQQAELAVERGGADAEDWQELLQSLGEHELSLWSAFLTFAQDLDAILWSGDDEELQADSVSEPNEDVQNPAQASPADAGGDDGASVQKMRQQFFELALWSQNLHAAVAELKNHAQAQNSEAIAYAVQRELWQKQRKAILDLLPS